MKVSAKNFFLLTLLTGITTSATAQFREEYDIDSLLRRVNSDIPVEQKIDPMARLARKYCRLGDSLSAEKYLIEAKTLAQGQRDNKYQIYVLTQELMSCAAARNINRSYAIIENLYGLISATGNRMAKALAYDYIASAKFMLDDDYDFKDHYSALHLAEKLPKNDPKSWRVIADVYLGLTTRAVRSEGYLGENTKDCLKHFTEAAYHSGDKDYICQSMNFILLTKLSASNPDMENVNAQANELLNFMENNMLSFQRYNQILTTLISLSIDHPGIIDTERLEKAAEKLKNVSDFITERDVLNMEMLLFSLKGNYDAAIHKVQEILRYDTEKNDMRLLKDDYYVLSVLYKKIDRIDLYGDALEQVLYYLQKTDNARLSEQQLVIETKYKLRKKELEIDHQKRITIQLFIIFSLIIFFITATFYFRSKSKRTQKENLLLENRQLQYEKLLSEKQLISANLSIEYKNKLLENIKQQIKENGNIKNLAKILKKGEMIGKNLDESSKIFIDTNPELFQKLQEKVAPEVLTPLNLRYCAYLMMGMGSKEIMELLCISENTFWTYKKKLKKKLKLTKGESLESFLRSLSLPNASNLQ
ncbi:MAG: hypothetical protein LBR48_09645 [Dysgonamonadaceae bacterium]|jgi:DNA-binding CsgD family transcriptional regulator|nr:hypothetical protein [Dysgonamonadaceae bacterium]